MSGKTAPADEIEKIRIEEEMEQSYIDYAMSVIIGRALPDVRDGLKPVQRRVLYAMHREGIGSNSGHRKSSNIVGDTMGDFHPHGDSAIYDALVRLAQDFSVRAPLVDGQGNFGSIDGDNPAAMRYTEARLSPVGEELLRDIDAGTVDYTPNYDDRLEEPEVLPAGLPNLLINGSKGIAVGMSTDIPPHNPGEVIDATIHLIDNPESDIDTLMEYIPGPDFPTGANIIGKNSIEKAYKSGRGRVTVRAEHHIEEKENGGSDIIITEIPFQTKKASLIEKIANIVKRGELDNVRDIRDESDRNGIRIVIELKQSAIPKVVENKLIDKVLEKTVSIINLALVDGEPRIMTLKELLEHYIEHRREVVRRRSQTELDEKEERAHILEGRLKAIENAEDIVELIRNTKNRDTAIEELQETFEFTEKQAEHITRMQLGSLTSLETDEIETEYEKVTNRIERLNEILENEEELLGVIKKELREAKEDHDSERKTRIKENADTVKQEDLIPKEEIAIITTQEGYIKRISTSEFKQYNRGSQGLRGISLKDSDKVTGLKLTHTHDRLLFLTDKGQVYDLKGYDIPDYNRNARGTPIINLLPLDQDESIEEVVPADMTETEEKFLTILTRKGRIKKTPLSEYDNILSTGIRAINVEESDEIVKAEVVHSGKDIFIEKNNGKAIRFSVDDVSSSGRSAMGVFGVKMESEDTFAVDFSTSDPEEEKRQFVLSFTENGYGKKTPIENYSKQSRYGKGLIDIKTSERNGDCVGIEVGDKETEIFFITDDGKVMRTLTSPISSVGRNTHGVKLVETNTNKVVDGEILRSQ